LNQSNKPKEDKDNADDSFRTDDSIRAEELAHLKEEVLEREKTIESMRMQVLTLEVQGKGKDDRIVELLSQLK